MSKFLKKICEDIFAKHKNNIDEIAIIIPNRRAAVYIQQYLATFFNKPFFSPKITTINEWITEHTELNILNQTELLFLLYDIYKSVDKEEAEDFDGFLKWGKIILSDFDEIDRYNLIPKEVFRDLRNIKDIDNWSFDNDKPLTKAQKTYADLWDKLPIYYEKLNSKLTEINACYQGKAYQNFALSTAKTVIGKSIFKPQHKHYYFVGFNALSRAEEIIIENLKAKNICTVFFNVDQHYINNKEHEAGHFYRKLRKKWNLKETVPNYINKETKYFEIIETAQQVAQAKIAGQIVKNLNKEELKNTAIILADESLLIPLSKSLPIDIESANITMGYPIKYSHLKSLFDLIFDLQFKFKKFNNNKLYHKTILKFVDHPFIQTIINDKTKIASFEKNLISSNQIFIGQTDFIKSFKNLKKAVNLIDVWHNDLPKGFKAIQDFVQLLYTSFKEKNNNELELEILYHFSIGITKFEDIWKKYPHELSLKSFKNLFQQFWQNESLSFLGNPTDGLQIMGILETRTLDFDNIIILSMNEGNLPKRNFSNSLIPRELKIHHKLPIEHDRDAIFAHHFYRLLHHAKKVYLTYNSTSEGTKDGEKSRFITQLLNELEFSKNPHILNYYTYSAKDLTSKTIKANYRINSDTEKILDTRFAKGLSPSALNTFIACPLDFYYKYILGLRESNEIEENIESSTFGSMIHNVLERIFKINFLKQSKPVDITTLINEKKNISTYLMDEYLSKFKKSDIKYGQNKLSFDVSVNLIEGFINKQIEELKQINFPIKITEIEQEIEANFKWKINGLEKQIKIKGLADRIEKFGTTYRIIDYKSGKCDFDKISIGKDKNISTFMLSDKKNYGRQLLMYALMFQQKFPKRKNFSAGIISMINLKEWVQNVAVTETNDDILTDEILDLFKAELKQIIEQMYDPNFVYEHNDKAKYCEYCNV